MWHIIIYHKIYTLVVFIMYLTPLEFHSLSLSIFICFH